MNYMQAMASRTASNITEDQLHMEWYNGYGLTESPVRSARLVSIRGTPPDGSL